MARVNRKPLASVVSLKENGFDVLFLSHAHSILMGDFPEALEEICNALKAIQLPITEIIGSGGGETKFTQRLRHALTTQGWGKHVFEIGKTIDGVPRESTSHEVDHVKRYGDVGVLAMEIEWNNKDPFYDRDLENFKRLHAEGAISVGIIITRGATLQEGLHPAVMKFAKERAIDSMEKLTANGVMPTPKQRANIMRRVERGTAPLPFDQAWTDNFVSNKYGQATTHWKKLLHRVERGVGNPCPLLLIGLPASIIVFDDAPVEQQTEDDVQEADISSK
ncbi:BglII/BstYI family type II restriction endonuclease [Verminephrobacter aporrectodeae]|uniref:BglII/BstYI family type II restriction endonuclease n=1 Tax=Verminephrobacter aporrectodeae TaxID=1110389 RepID=UPI0022432695|nr:BglII/BstYI family type II restriction endonuclease [Verminephrobacter aporrectodeae]MCW8177231.1 restriction endonuclease [Verminephrobacter aporrectodeae subsp. tuberculatae]MCW8204659.1 restriction endonuclease [Verminephrobacter aporrectodeae subsp. tuberculatae]